MSGPRTKGRTALRIYSVFAFGYLFTPIVWIVLFSFNKPKGNYNLAWSGFTFDNWLHPFANVIHGKVQTTIINGRVTTTTELTRSFWKSMQVAGISVALATGMGAAMAMALSKYRFRGSSLVDIFLVLPLTTPEVVMGASLLTLFIDRNVDRGFVTIVIAHTMFCLSFVALTVKARIRGFDWRLEEAAMDLGAGPWRTFSKVTFPLILPGILAAALLRFALSIDDYIITSFNKGSTDTMPIHIWDSFKAEFRPQVNVLATIILLVSVVALIVTSVGAQRRAG